jgi:hypothetical protein
MERGGLVLATYFGERELPPGELEAAHAIMVSMRIHGEEPPPSANKPPF